MIDYETEEKEVLTPANETRAIAGRTNYEKVQAAIQRAADSGRHYVMMSTDIPDYVIKDLDRLDYTCLKIPNSDILLIQW